jgi:hypothetical protein
MDPSENGLLFSHSRVNRAREAATGGVRQTFIRSIRAAFVTVIVMASVTFGG